MLVDILQIGAHVGTSSNNISTINKLKENSIAIFAEPVYFLFKCLVNNLNELYPNNKFIFINKACSNRVGKLKLYVPNVPIYNKENEPEYIERGLVSWSDQLASVLPSHISDHHLEIPINEIYVDCSSIDSIIKEYQISEINYLCIDTEGHDYEVLEGLNLEILKPKQIKFEHKHMEGSNKPIGDKYNSLISRLESYGYQIKEKNAEDTVVAL